MWLEFGPYKLIVFVIVSSLLGICEVPKTVKSRTRTMHPPIDNKKTSRKEYIVLEDNALAVTPHEDQEPKILTKLSRDLFDLNND